MMHSIKPVLFKNRDRHTLFGILHTPENITKKQVIVLLSPGVKTRVAPHRLYKKIAQKLNELGYLVFRFDFYGTGDSEGEIEVEQVADYYGSVAVGRYSNDTIDAMNFLEETLERKEFLLGGLCGGALTGLLAAKNDERVVGLFGLGIPVIAYSANIDKSKFLTQGQLKQLRKGYIKKLTDYKSWVRLLTFKSDFKVLLKSIFQPYLKKKKKKPAPLEPGKEVSPESSDYNTLFGPAFFNMAKDSRHLLMIYSGADRLGWEFDEKFVDYHKEQLDKCKDNYEIKYVEHANHILSDSKWFKGMFVHVSNWLDAYYS